MNETQVDEVISLLTSIHYALICLCAVTGALLGVGFAMIRKWK